ncbi:MAG: transcription antitermination factor NusB [Chloroflexi bacterium]|nr:transcription antitermination factor NusB [Chloroflexota bacterium]
MALQVLYEVDATAHPMADALDARLEDRPLKYRSDVSFVRKLTYGVTRNWDVINSILTRYAPDWPLDQMGIVDRNILRIAIYEIGGMPNTSLQIAINEAVELAKRYGSTSTAKFINGVLSTLADHENDIIQQIVPNVGSADDDSLDDDEEWEDE